MKRTLVLVIAAMILAGAISFGPAPNSGDGISDGSGLDTPFYAGHLKGDCPGPAPNAGDGIPDGSGW